MDAKDRNDQRVDLDTGRLNYVLVRGSTDSVLKQAAKHTQANANERLPTVGFSFLCDGR